MHLVIRKKKSIDSALPSFLSLTAFGIAARRIAIATIAVMMTIKTICQTESVPERQTNKRSSQGKSMIGRAAVAADAIPQPTNARIRKYNLGSLLKIVTPIINHRAIELRFGLKLAC